MVIQSFGNMTLELDVLICKQSSFDTKEVQGVKLIQEVCEVDDIMSLCISDLLEMVLVTNKKFLINSN